MSNSSSLTIVPVAVVETSVALLGLLNWIEKVSSVSRSLSPLTSTVMNCTLSPGAKVSVPLVAV